MISSKIFSISEKITTFANVNRLERHIEILLLSNDCVIVPDFGGFMAHQVDARYDDRDSMFLPPLRTVGFNPQLKLNDSLLALSYVEAYDISYPEAINRIAEEVAEIRQHLENDGKYEINNIGTLFLNEDGNYTFEPCEAGILTPDYYGLGGVNMLPLSTLAPLENNTVSIETTPMMPLETAQVETPSTAVNSVFDAEITDENEEENSEFILIKKSWLRNLAAACIALIAFFALSTPLKTPNVQTSGIDTGMLTKIMPKEMVTQGENANSLSSEALSNNAIKVNTEKKDDLKEQIELKNAQPYYSIVLASRVTKRNAASYVEDLQAKGLKDAKVVITPTNVKVVYGSYSSENEAHKALNKLRNNEVFADSWITKVKD